MKGWNLVPVFCFTERMDLMQDSATVSAVRALAQPLCDELGLFLWDVRYEKEGATWYLRVYIDKDGGIDMYDCEALHRPLDKLLDEADPISGSYVFEVCSPGLGRELRRPEHFEVCIGDEIRVRFIRPRSGEKEMIGTLVSYDKTCITLRTGDGSEDTVTLADTASVKLNDDTDLF